MDWLTAAPVVAADQELASAVRALQRLAGRATSTIGRVCAVLIGLGSFSSGSGGMKSAADSVEGVQAALLDEGARAENVSRLMDHEATGPAIRAALRSAGHRSRKHAVLIYWCGPGQLDAMRCFDGETIGAADVARLAGTDATLVADGIAAGPPGGLSATPPATPRLTLLRPLGPVGGRVVWHPRLDGRPGKARYGPLTIALALALRTSATAGTLRASALVSPAGPPSVVGAARNALLLKDPVASRLDAIMDRARGAELASTAALVDQLLERRNGIDAEAQLQLGILRSQGGDVEAAVQALERAVQQFNGNRAGEALAHLHLGRVLLDSGRDRARAVSECRLATERDPDLGAAWFWLGRAIAELVERETTAQASAALRAYLARGAPIGRRSEVIGLLDAMAGKTSAGTAATGRSDADI